MLVLVTSVLVGILTALIIFSISFVRIIGTQTEQQTAIESAAIAAAKDLSKIVVNTPEFGYVSLSDYAPIGSATRAGDGYPLPVKSINTLIGTARLDLIIADKLGQPIMEQMAILDKNNALIAKDRLVTVLTSALANGGSGQDKDGNTITPYMSAENAYRQNQIRMSGSSNYVTGSLQLSLGSLLSGTSTRIPVPEPQSEAPVPANARIGNFYRSYINVPFKGVDFVFGAIGESIKIVDHKNWVTTASALPYQIPTVVRAEAVQNVHDLHNSSGMNIRAVACAQTATVHDPLPSPGALSLSFPDGKIPEITRPRDCYEQAKLNAGGGGTNTTLLTAKVGDFPLDAGSNLSVTNWPLSGSISAEPPANVWRACLHDWIRRAGTKANITSIVNMQSMVLNLPTPATRSWIAPVRMGGPYVLIGTIPAGIIHIFKFAPDGTVVYQSKPLTPLPLYASSHEQFHGEALKGFHDSAIGHQDIPVVQLATPPDPPPLVRLKDDFDIYFRDEVRQPGSIKGGKHGGEPLSKPIVAYTPPLNGIGPIAMGSNMSMGHEFSYPLTSLSVVGDGGPPPPPPPGGPAGPGGPNPPVPGPNKGYPPFVQPRNDFGITYNPSATIVATMPGSSGPLRPFYNSVGTAVDIRFRRMIDVEGLPGATSDFGYITIVAP